MNDAGRKALNSSVRVSRVESAIANGIASVVEDDDSFTDNEIVAALANITRYFTSKILREESTIKE